MSPLSPCLPLIGVDITHEKPPPGFAWVSSVCVCVCVFYALVNMLFSKNLHWGFHWGVELVRLCVCA